MQRTVEYIEEFKTEIARRIVLDIEEFYKDVMKNIEDNKVKNILDCEYDLAWRYAINPLGQNPDSLVKVLRGNDNFLYKFYTFVAVCAPDRLDEMHELVKKSMVNVSIDECERKYEDGEEELEWRDRAIFSRELLQSIPFIQYMMYKRYHHAKN